MNTIIDADGQRLEFASGTRALRGLYDPLGLDGAHDHDLLWRSAHVEVPVARAGVGR
jgi:hypothetical protein